MLRAHFSKYILLLVSGAVFSLTVLFAAIPMRVVRKTFGRPAYWIGQTLVACCLFGLALQVPSLGFLPVACAFMAMVVLVGLYAEVEENGSSIFGNAFIAILGTMGGIAVGAALWIQHSGVNLMALLRPQLEPAARHFAEAFPDSAVSAETLALQLPANVTILLMLALAAALVWERRTALVLRLPQRRESGHASLAGFRVPDVFVWIAIVATLGAFLNHNHPWLSIVAQNVLYVLAALYFFQGLAVLVVFFRAFRVGVFWQGFWIFMIFLQLLLMMAIALVGFADFWLEFRDRIAKKATELDKRV